jgi:Ca-activated chloride channel family protein
MSDAEPLVHLLGGLGTRAVPRAGSRPDLGLDLAREMLARAGAAAGEVILVGDSAGDERTLEAARALRAAGFPVSVLAVGTPHGGPVRLAGGTFARTETGEIHVAKAEFAALEGVAREGGGEFRLLPLAGETPRLARAAQVWGESRAGTAVLRQDDGAWLALLALPFAALLFRRGWLASLALLALALPPPEALAFDWQDLWRRPEQQAAAAFARAGAGAHSRLLARLGPESPWQAMLLYRGARYAEAAARFAESDTADAHYNRGNALALDDRLEEALLAYGAALERNPGMRDANANRALVREALARRDDWHGAQPLGRAGSPSRSVGRRDSATGGRGAKPEGGSLEEPRDGPGASREARADPSPAREDPASAAKDREDAADAAELRRLEQLLAKIPDDPGSMLANRFARELQRRGTPRQDPGARW